MRKLYSLLNVDPEHLKKADFSELFNDIQEALKLAIDLAIPPASRFNYEQLEYLYERMETILEAA